MQLLAGKNYDPGTAVTKATSALLAMTAIDTTNLRLAITVPAHGIIRVRMQTMLFGATTFPQIMLGVMNGATVIGRQTPLAALPGTALATTRMPIVADFLCTGLAPGAMNVDAAYAVQIVVAATVIEYGGPDNNSGANAWGGFAFEIYDPKVFPTNFTLTSIDTNGRLDVIKVAGTTQTAKDIGAAVPAAAAGASGGLLISGSNAGTTTLGALTVTGATTHTGNVILSDGLTISAPSTLNRAGLDIAGNGTGAAIKATGGATGIGFNVIGGGTSGDGIKVTTTIGHGINLAPVGTDKHGLFATGGSAGTSDGIKAAAGSGGVDFRGNQTGNIVGTLSTLTTYTGNTVQTGDGFARLGAPVGASISADIAATKALLPTALVSGRIDASVGAMAAGTLTAAAIASDAITDAKVAADVTIASVTGAVGSVTGAVGSVTGAVGSVAGNVVGSVGSVVGSTAQTGDSFARIGAAGAGLTALGDTRIANIKTKTDSLTFTTAGEVDANIHSINNTAVTGVGSPADPWSP